MGLLNERWDLFQGLFRGFFEELARPVLPETTRRHEKQKTRVTELQVGTTVATIKDKQIKPA